MPRLVRSKVPYAKQGSSVRSNEPFAMIESKEPPSTLHELLIEEDQKPW
jgi:hypothetical protein